MVKKTYTVQKVGMFIRLCLFHWRYLFWMLSLSHSSFGVRIRGKPNVIQRRNEEELKGERTNNQTEEIERMRVAVI